MSTQIDKLAKQGVQASFEYDNDEQFSLKFASSVFELPMWRPQWAYNFIASEEEFENLSEEEYTESLACGLCCDNNCNKCHCPCGSDIDHNESKPDFQTKHGKRAYNCWRTFTRLNPFFNLHFVLHIVINLPMFYTTVALMQFFAVVFRFFRWTWLSAITALQHCGSCGICNPGTTFNIFLVCIGNPFYLILTGFAGSLIYWIDTVSNALFLRPMIAGGVGYDIFMRNNMIEPLELGSGFRKWVDNTFSDWAWAANMLVEDPNEMEISGKFRDPIMSPKQLLAHFSVLAPLITQKLGSEIIAPFGIQIVILWIVFNNLYIEVAEEVDDDVPLIRQLAAAGAFLYYLIKARESAGKFAQIARGHTGNLFLFVDFMGNVVFPYFVIPMAITIVLNSEGVDIVLNLLALDFVTTIDEELFDESVKERCRGPFVFVFKIKELPKRFLGYSAKPRKNKDPDGNAPYLVDDTVYETLSEELKRNYRWKSVDYEKMLVIDVWSKKEIEEDLYAFDDKLKGTHKKTTEYWVRDQDLSQFNAKLLDTDRLAVQWAMMQNSKTGRASWNTCPTSRLSMAMCKGDAKKLKDDVKSPASMAVENLPENTGWGTDDRFDRKILDNAKIHFRLQGIPMHCDEKTIIEAFETMDKARVKAGLPRTFSMLGDIIGISYLDKPEVAQEDTCIKEMLGTASVFFARPMRSQIAYSRYEAHKGEFPLRVKQKNKAKFLELRIFPVVPVAEGEKGERMGELINYFDEIMSTNYKPEFYDTVSENHIKVLGEFEENGEDSRVMVVYDFPFGEEEHHMIIKGETEPAADVKGEAKDDEVETKGEAKDDAKEKKETDSKPEPVRDENRGLLASPQVARQPEEQPDEAAI